MFDPGISLKGTTLAAAWQLLVTGRVIGVRYELSETESLLDNSYLTPITIELE